VRTGAAVNERAKILLVDDRDENLLALAATLEPLGQELVQARSGEEALRRLLQDDYALILLDVQMPGLDGFATAALIKQRERTRHVPIIFLTAISKEAEHVFRGYEAGAVDYLMKPLDAHVLRAKASVFIDLWHAREEARRNEELLRERELAAERRESEERYRSLAEALPQIVWTTDAAGKTTYFNERWYEFTGRPHDSPLQASDVIHPEDLGRAVTRWEEARDGGGIFEIEYRFRRADGAWRWQLARALPLRDEGGTITGWVGTATDIEDRRRLEERERFLAEAGWVLGSSLDYEQTLADVARLAVPRVADWCAVDIFVNGTLQRVALEHVDPLKLALARELEGSMLAAADAAGAAAIHAREPVLVREVDEAALATFGFDEQQLEIARALAPHSYITVPLLARGEVFGSISLVTAESGRTYGEDDVSLAQELARHAAAAIDNARLYDEAERRGRATRVLAAIGDGVVMVDGDGIVRLWNPAAAAITGLADADVLGRKLTDVLPGWARIQSTIPVGEAGSPARTETVPLELDGRELWLSASGVGFAEGTVYAFRDLTEERALEELKSEFVATVSHELRTPLAAIYGSAQTIRRGDLELDDTTRHELLGVIATESDRLASIVNDLLLASHLDSGRLPVHIERCDPRELANAVVESARTHLPEEVALELRSPEELPPVSADPAQLQQVLANLVDNAIKYSPEGGPVRLEIENGDARVRFSIVDEGLGIPASEHRRIFEKFYRLDPDMTRGIGGTGLGLYISRELVRRMDGEIWVESRLGKGSTFVVELPSAR
jgi:PAS domain S-box-containing protein